MIYMELKNLRKWIQEYPYYIAEIDKIPADKISDLNRAILKEFMTTTKTQTALGKEYGMTPTNLRQHLMVAKSAFMRKVNEERGT